MADDQPGPSPEQPAPVPDRVAPVPDRVAPAFDHVAPAAAGRRRSLPPLLPVLTAAGGLLIGVVLGLWVLPAVGTALGAAGPTVIETALETCDVSPGGYFALGDDGTSLSMQTEGAESPGADLADVACVLAEVDVPDSVLTRIDSTRALDGRQEASWADLDASGGYHPDSGLDLVLERHRE